MSGTGPATKRSLRQMIVMTMLASRRVRVSPVAADMYCGRHLPARVCSGGLPQNSYLGVLRGTPRSALRGTDMLAAHIGGHGLESIQALIVAVCVLIVVFWRIALTILLAVAAILMLLMITSGAAVLLQNLLHLIK